MELVNHHGPHDGGEKEQAKIVGRINVGVNERDQTRTETKVTGEAEGQQRQQQRHQP